MKYVLLLLVIAAVLWLLRGRSRSAGPAAAPPPDANAQEEMLACGYCGVHLPRSEALAGPGGVFCSEAHRRAQALRESPP